MTEFPFTEIKDKILSAWSYGWWGLSALIYEYVCNTSRVEYMIMPGPTEQGPLIIAERDVPQLQCWIALIAPVKGLHKLIAIINSCDPYYNVL